MHRINGTGRAGERTMARRLLRARGQARRGRNRLESLTARKTYIEHQLEADRALLAEHEASGYVRLSRETVHKGDVIDWGSWKHETAIVTRVNPKTVTLDRREYPRTLPYEQIKSVECPHEAKTVTVTHAEAGSPAGQRQSWRSRTTSRAAGGARWRIDARFEFFPADRAGAVVRCGWRQAGGAAGIEPGMTVLEPSAGNGAMVAPLVKLGAVVD